MTRSGRSRATEMPRTTVTTLTVRRAPQLPGEDGPRGHVKVGSVSLVCALGKSGVTHRKREGDRGTPAGRFAVLHGYYRSDRMGRPFSRIPLHALRRDLGWCDDPSSALYNRAAPLPLSAGHEVMWRADVLYDIVLVLDYNIRPRRAGHGSAIFLHCAKPGLRPTCAKSGLRPTLGCIALMPSDLRRLLPRLGRQTRVTIL